MDHTDHAAEAASAAPAEASRRSMTGILEAAASRNALAALEQALASGTAIGSKREIASGAKSLADASLRAAEHMREHLLVMEELQRLTAVPAR
jgi:hypothetical protein